MFPRITSSPLTDMDPKGGGFTSEPIVHSLRMVFHFIYILVSIVLGLLLFYMPLMRFWENNYLLYLYPQLRPLVSNHFFKGFVLGLGIANIAIGIHEFVQIANSWKSKHPSQ